MPLLSSTLESNHAAVAIWQLQAHEDLAALASGHGLDLEAVEEIRHPQRQRESTAGRLALYEAGKALGLSLTQLHKDEFGKPHISNEGYAVSITHSADYAAALVTRQQCGIDVEPIRPKLNRVCSKFLSEAELSHAADDTEHLCVYWTCKEAVYKYYGKRQLIFKEDIIIAPFELSDDFLLTATLQAAGSKETVRLRSIRLGQYRLSYTLGAQQL